MSKGSEQGEETARAGLRVELFVADVARSAAFYRQVLGFEVVREAPSGYTSIAREGAVLGLNDASNMPLAHPACPREGHPVGLGVELVVMVQDVVAAHAHATASHGPEVSALVRQPWGLTDFRVVDPDGYYVRVTGLSAAR